MNVLYLTALLLSLAAMVALDVRFRLFFARDARAATIVLVSGVLFFLAWDLAGVGLGIFFRGGSPLLSGVLLGPELPLEEAFFLALLCYVSMNAFAAASILLARRRLRSGRNSR